MISRAIQESSKVCRLRSFQRHHNKCFGTVLGKTHEIPKDLRTKLHNQWAFSQWRSKWSIISPQRWHIIHQSTKSKPLSLKLSRKQSFHTRKCFKFFIFKIKNKKLCSPIANPSVKWTSTKMDEISFWG